MLNRYCTSYLSIIHLILSTVFPANINRVAGVLPRTWDQTHAPTDPEPKYSTAVQIIRFISTIKNLVDLACILPFYVHLLMKGLSKQQNAFSKVVSTVCSACVILYLCITAILYDFFFLAHLNYFQHFSLTLLLLPALPFSSTAHTIHLSAR